MPKQSPVPDEFDKPFYDACNEERLVVQHCANCNRFQFPPRAMCPVREQRRSTGGRLAAAAGSSAAWSCYDSPSERSSPTSPSTSRQSRWTKNPR